MIRNNKLLSSRTQEILNSELFDGTFIKIERIRQILRAGAIPSIFPNLPFYLTVHNIKRKTTLEKFLNVDKKR